jgi:hypothetical protein
VPLMEVGGPSDDQDLQAVRPMSARLAIGTVAALVGLAALGSRQGSPARASRFRWCPTGPAELVNVISVSIEDLSYSQAIRRMDLKAGPVWWSGMPTDWSASYWEARLPSGRKAYILQHGGIEHIFTDDGNLGADEGPLAERMGQVAVEMDEAGELSSSLLSELSPDEVDQVRRRVRGRP